MHCVHVALDSISMTTMMFHVLSNGSDIPRFSDIPQNKKLWPEERMNSDNCKLFQFPFPFCKWYYELEFYWTIEELRYGEMLLCLKSAEWRTLFLLWRHMRYPNVQKSGRRHEYLHYWKMPARFREVWSRKKALHFMRRDSRIVLAQRKSTTFRNKWDYLNTFFCFT